MAVPARGPSWTGAASGAARALGEAAVMATLPLMAGVTLGVVFILVTAAFRSLVGATRTAAYANLLCAPPFSLFAQGELVGN